MSCNYGDEQGRRPIQLIMVSPRIQIISEYGPGTSVGRMAQIVARDCEKEKAYEIALN